MQEIRTKRLLAHGPLLSDLSDLLYYDALIYPIIQSSWVIVDNKERKPKFFDKLGRPVFISQADEEKLVDANLIIRKESIFQSDVLNQFYKENAFAPKFPEDARRTSEILRAAGQWIYHEDVLIRNFASMAQTNGLNTVTKLLSSNFSQVFSSGKDNVISIIFSNLPRLDRNKVSVNDLIDFLKDEETQVKRRKLFTWQNDIELKIEKGDFRVEHLTDLIADRLNDYIDHLKHSDVRFIYGIAETILYVSAAMLLELQSSAVAVIGVAKGLLEIHKRKLKLKEEEKKAAGRELAYIVHAHKRFGS